MKQCICGSTKIESRSLPDRRTGYFVECRGCNASYGISKQAATCIPEKYDHSPLLSWIRQQNMNGTKYPMVGMEAIERSCFESAPAT